MDRRGLVTAAASCLASACGPLGGVARSSQQPSLRIHAPKVAGVASTNLKRPGSKPYPSYTYAIEDADARVHAARIPFKAAAPGLASVEVLTHGRPAAVFTPGADGEIDGWLDLRREARGPLIVDVVGRDVPPGHAGSTIDLKMRLVLFVVDGHDASPRAARPAGHPAHGRALIFEDHFTSLSAGHVANAAAGKTWFTNKPGWGDFGDAAFEQVEHPQNPFTVEDTFLRIRAQHDEAYVDPYGYKRKWYGGILASAFSDGSASFSATRGYFEARMLLPQGAGTWPAFWLVEQRSITKAEDPDVIELDILEAYGFNSGYNVTVHLWNAGPNREVGSPVNPKTATGYDPKVADGGDLTWGFHDFGLDVTDTDYIFYCDGVEVKRFAAFVTKVKPNPFYVVVNMGMGGGWPSPVPPGARHDLWVDYIRVYGA